jgi:hypothetical protein
MRAYVNSLKFDVYITKDRNRCEQAFENKKFKVIYFVFLFIRFICLKLLIGACQTRTILKNLRPKEKPK